MYKITVQLLATCYTHMLHMQRVPFNNPEEKEVTIIFKFLNISIKSY